MDATEWMQTFKAVHEAAKKSGSNDRHRAMKEELARSLVQAQGLVVGEGQSPRRTFRIAQAWQVELNGAYKCLTRDVSGGGFSALVPTNLSVGDEVRFSIRIGGGEPVTGSAKVVAAIRQTGNSKVSFSIASMPTADAERLENAIFDSVLTRYLS
ncbi:MAG: PilZ domain-containing protein [Myxococcaceae bacterium]|nr:PilZ domain-containing protein [Myxococcaceae bacterium]